MPQKLLISSYISIFVWNKCSKSVYRNVIDIGVPFFLIMKHIKKCKKNISHIGFIASLCLNYN